MAKNPINSSIITRTIETRARELVDNPVLTNPLSVLAHAHALLLYQIIRLFDGDLRMHAAAEAAMPALEQAAFALMQHTTFEEGTFEPYGIEGPFASRSPDDTNSPSHVHMALKPTPPAHTPQAMRTFWEQWIFQESARRTFLIIFFFLRTYHLMKGLDIEGAACDGRLNLCHSFTLSAHLWAARDFCEFGLAWETKRHFVVKNTE